jgi:hypothetical protein
LGIPEIDGDMVGGTAGLHWSQPQQFLEDPQSGALAEDGGRNRVGSDFPYRYHPVCGRFLQATANCRQSLSISGHQLLPTPRNHSFNPGSQSAIGSKRFIESGKFKVRVGVDETRGDDSVAEIDLPEAFSGLRSTGADTCHPATIAPQPGVLNRLAAFRQQPAGSQDE